LEPGESRARRDGVATQTPLEVVRIWHDALNEGDVERLLAHVAPDVEVAGPRGSARGADQVQEWVARAGIRMVPTAWYARGDHIVAEEETSWSMPDGTLSEPMLIATAFQVTDGRVSRITRYSDVGAALNATGLQPSDGVAVEGAPSS
jgi:ketosteroid isomerase-like protein